MQLDLASGLNFLRHEAQHTRRVKLSSVWCYLKGVEAEPTECLRSVGNWGGELVAAFRQTDGITTGSGIDQPTRVCVLLNLKL